MPPSLLFCYLGTCRIIHSEEVLMTLLEELMEKRAALQDNLASLFASKEVKSDGKPVVRNTILRGNTGQNHLIRKGKKLENVRRVEHAQKKPSEASARRLLGLFGSEE